MTRAEVESLDNGQACVRLTIEDDGAGVPLEKCSEILQRGVRLDSTHAGQGFGLAIVADIIASYQGVVAVGESALGGALFTLELPIR
jgi:two-component system sensor histidine kinase PhoQ